MEAIQSDIPSNLMVSDNFILICYYFDMLKMKIQRNPMSPTILVLERVQNRGKVQSLERVQNLVKVRSLERAANLVKAKSLKRVTNPVKVRTSLNRMKAERQRSQKETKYHRNKVVGTSTIINHM